jgi:hypothetical protein
MKEKIKKQKVYEIGTLVSHKISEYDGFLMEADIPWENGIIIERLAREGLDRGTTETYYTIRWDGDHPSASRIEAKTLKGMVKSGKIKILSEG